jgi:hypothetical protein
MEALTHFFTVLRRSTRPNFPRLTTGWQVRRQTTHTKQPTGGSSQWLEPVLPVSGHGRRGAGAKTLRETETVWILASWDYWVLGLVPSHHTPNQRSTTQACCRQAGPSVGWTSGAGGGGFNQGHLERRPTRRRLAWSCLAEVTFSMGGLSFVLFLPVRDPPWKL